MRTFERQMYTLGIPAKTRTTKVAPGRSAGSPFFEAANVATDHPAAHHDVAEKIACRKHAMNCLLHEAVLRASNGSVSMSNGVRGNATRETCSTPATPPTKTCSFCCFCGLLIGGVHLYGPLLRALSPPRQ